MPRYALVDASGYVENVMVWDGAEPHTPDEGLTAVLDEDDNVGPGWSYADGEFIAPPPEPMPPPQARKRNA
jgi:hypothetical protein